MPSEKVKTYSIAEASQQLGGVTYRKLRYYEEKFDLVIGRDSAYNRVYSQENIDLIRTIIEMKEQGITLDGIKRILIEKGLIEPKEDHNLVIVDENTVELKEYLINEIRRNLAEVIREELQEELRETNKKLDQLQEANERLEEKNRQLEKELQSLARDTKEHYQKIDYRLAQWRESQERPWFKKIFKK